MRDIATVYDFTRKWVHGQAALALFLVAAVLGLPAQAQAPKSEKLSDDPTKIVTKLGFRYSEFGTVYGSVAFGPVTKLNVSVSEDEQWSIGGSYLFDFGIVNAAASRKTLSSGIEQTQYSVGTFVPLVALGIEPRGWLLFPAAGVNYTEGSPANIDFDFGDALSFETSSKGGYLGLLALKSITKKWVVKSGLVLSAGSNDYSGYSIGGGLTYNASPVDSISAFASYTDNSFGTRDLLGVSYTREF